MAERKELPRNLFPAACPWGSIQHATEYAPGIIFVATASHGGFLISPERYRDMPEQYRACAFLKDWPRAFEEDCAWYAVALSFPQWFSAEERNDAQRIYDAVYKNR